MGSVKYARSIYERALASLMSRMRGIEMIKMWYCWEVISRVKTSMVLLGDNQYS